MINKLFYKTLATMIEKETGIVYGEADYDRLTFRVEKLKELLKVTTDDDLLNILKNSPSSNIQSLLVSTATNNETSFFRDRKPFDVLSKHLIPTIMANKTHKQLKIWCAAASTGQEPYTIAMVCKESPELQGALIDIKASDIDQEVLKKCRAGIYNQTEVQRGLPIQFLLKYFDQIDLVTWTVKNELKSFINFYHFNLLNTNYPTEEYDIVFCRNVLIYQSLENKSKVINKIYNALRPGGYLVLGGAENLIGIKSNFKMTLIDDIMVYQKV